MHGIFEGRAPNVSFQSESYLSANPDIAHTGLTPVQHYVMEGCFQKRLLAPLPRPEEKRLEIEKARLAKELAELRREKASAVEENDLLLTHLHKVQEELESYFLKNKSLLSEREALSQTAVEQQTALEALKKELAASKASGVESGKKRAELAGQVEKHASDKVALDARLSTLVAARSTLEARVSTLTAEHEALSTSFVEFQTELYKSQNIHSERTMQIASLSAKLSEVEKSCEALKKELEASKASGAEVEKKRAEIAGQLDVRSKERDQGRLERDNITKERDQLKKTAGDRATRIAELEAQIADQAERQKQIDEQMVRAETQLEMLKEFLQPAFQ
jgi:chromosome segregation ATPase